MIAIYFYKEFSDIVTRVPVIQFYSFLSMSFKKAAVPKLVFFKKKIQVGSNSTLLWKLMQLIEDLEVSDKVDTKYTHCLKVRLYTIFIQNHVGTPRKNAILKQQYVHQCNSCQILISFACQSHSASCAFSQIRWMQFGSLASPGRLLPGC